MIRTAPLHRPGAISAAKAVADTTASPSVSSSDDASSAETSNVVVSSSSSSSNDDDDGDNENEDPSAPSAISMDRSLPPPPSLETTTTTKTTTSNDGGYQNKSAYPSTSNKLRTPRILLTVTSVVLLLIIPLILLTGSYLCQQLYLGPFVRYMNAFRIVHDGSDDRGYYYSLDNDVTYYHRECTREDITTAHLTNKTDRSNLLILPPGNETTPEYAQDVMLTHGAVILPQVLTAETANNLRTYLESRHRIQDTLSWKEKFFAEISRLSLGLGFDDDTSIQQALHEIGHNPMIQSTLEGLFGVPDAAIVEISTLTSLHGAENQGLHTDSDFFGSSLLYARNFLHSYTMFVALQDTTSRMGATTVCPGTHWCANPDMEDLCLPNEYEYQEEGDDVEEALEAYNQNEAFDVSSNGVTSKEGGVLQKGDAMMFNQNVFHRGAQNDDPKNKDTNRVMFIVTFVNKRDFERDGDVRQQGMGTYYYQRWTMWGHSFSDFRHAFSSSTKSFWRQPWATFKALGVTASQAVPWTEHVARQLSNQMDFFSEYELPDFKKYMEDTNGDIASYLQKGTSSDDWHDYIPEVLENFVEASTYVYQRGLLAALILGLFLLPSSGGGTSISRLSFVKLVLGLHVLIGGLACAIFYGIQRHSYIGQKIHSREIDVPPFPAESAASSLSIPEATTLPDRMDYLVGSRYDADFLGSYNRALDYHPGNMRLDKLIDQYGSSELPLDCLTDSIREEWNAPQPANPPRMLLQDASSGYWTLMGEDSAWKQLQRLILRRQQPILQTLDKHLLQAMAKARFGRWRHTAMAKDKTVTLLQDLLQKLAPSSFPSSNDQIGKRKQDSNSPLLKVQSQLHPTSRTTIGDSLRTPTTLLHPLGIPPYLSPGSRVWAASTTGQRWHGLWEAARIIAEKDDDGLVKVLYDKTGNKRSLAPTLVRPFRHLIQGETVECLHGKERTFRWSEAEIESVSPLGFYNVRTKGQVLISRLAGDDIRFLPPSQEYQPGDFVWAAFSDDGAWTKATVMETFDNGVLVGFAEDNNNRMEEKRWIDVQPYFTIEADDFVEVQVDDGSWWNAKVDDIYATAATATDDDGSSDDDKVKREFDVYIEQYDQFLEGVDESYIRPLLPLLDEGIRVMANFGNEGGWFPGIIESVNTYHRTYNIKYDDGDLENHVNRDRLQII